MKHPIPNLSMLIMPSSEKLRFGVLSVWYTSGPVCHWNMLCNVEALGQHITPDATAPRRRLQRHGAPAPSQRRDGSIDGQISQIVIMGPYLCTIMHGNLHKMGGRGVRIGCSRLGFIFTVCLYGHCPKQGSVGLVIIHSNSLLIPMD